MTYIRFQIDGAVPQENYDALPAATKQGIKDKILQLKSFCQRISDQEDTVRFKWHICNHPNGSCGEEQDI